MPIAGASNVLTTGTNALSTAAELVVAARRERICISITNTSTDILTYIGFDSTVTAGTGHAISPRTECKLEHYIGPIYMIAASATPTVTYAEW
jgi:hypothetical protein